MAPERLTHLQFQVGFGGSWLTEIAQTVCWTFCRARVLKTRASIRPSRVFSPHAGLQQYDRSMVREICNKRVKQYDVLVSCVVRDELLALPDGVRISQDSAMSPTVTRQDVKEEITRLHRRAAVADVSLSGILSRIKSLDASFGPSPSIEIIFGIATELERGFDGGAAGRMDGLRQTISITCALLLT